MSTRRLAYFPPTILVVWDPDDYRNRRIEFMSYSPADDETYWGLARALAARKGLKRWVFGIYRLDRTGRDEDQNTMPFREIPRKETPSQPNFLVTSRLDSFIDKEGSS